MQLNRFLQAVLITGAVASQKEIRQVVVTVTLAPPPSPLGIPTAPPPLPISETPPPWGQTSSESWLPLVPTMEPLPTSISTTSDAFSLPPWPPTSFTASLNAPSPSPGPIEAPKCGKGFTYCGYMLTGEGHNFTTQEVDKAYCSGLPELCAGGKFKTDIDQAVFVCMSNQPSTVQLMCACSGTCLNNATSNYIAHCDKPCVNQ